MQDYIIYGAFGVFILFMIRRAFMFQSIQKKVSRYLEEGALIVDVRSPAEYGAGHVDGSINIPLSEVANRVNELDPQKTILVCCASGTRSGMATSLLKAKGFKKAMNAGPWSGLRQ